MKLFAKFIILFVVAITIYSNTLDSAFVFDDIEFIENNVYVKDFSRMGGFWKEDFPKTRLIPLYSFALDYKFYHIDPKGYHLTNLLIHVAATMAVWWFVSLLFYTPALVTKEVYKHRDLFSFLSALLFAANPVNTQAVSYITQRFASISTFFYVMTLCLYLKARMSNAKFAVRFLLFSGSFLMAVCAIFSKEVSITVPFAIIAMEVFFITLGHADIKKQLSSNQNKEAIKKKAKTSAVSTGMTSLQRLPKPLPKKSFVILGTMIVFTILLINILYHGRIYGIFLAERISESHPGDVITLGTYLLTQARVFMTFLRLLFFPVNQNLDYDYVISKGLFNPPSTFLSILGLLALFAFAVKFRRKYTLISFSILWFFLTLSANLVPRVNLIFEHKLYLVTAGFSVLYCAAAYQLTKNKKITTIIILIIAVIFSFLTYNRNKVWKNEITLWEDVARKSPNKFRAYHNLGTAYLKAGDLENSLKYLDIAIEMDPRNEKLYTTRGAAYYHAGRYKEALDDLNKAIELNPKYYGAYVNRGLVYESIKQTQLAFNDYQQALKIHNSFALAFIRRGYLLSSIGKQELALKDFEMAIKVNPDGVDGYLGKAITLFRLNRPDEARKFFKKALKVDPQSSVAYDNLGFYYFLQKDYKNAILQLDRAIRYQKMNASAYNHRGLVYRALKNYKMAYKDFTKTIQLTPDNFNAYNNRGAISVELNDLKSAIADFNSAIEIAPSYDGAYNNRGFMYLRSGNVDIAQKDFSRAIELNPQNASAYYNRGLTYSKQSRLEDALKDFNQSIALNPQYANAYFQRGVIHYMNNDYDSSIDDFTTVIKLMPSFAQAYMERAKAYKAKNMFTLAVKDAETARGLGQNIDEEFMKGLNPVK